LAALARLPDECLVLRASGGAAAVSGSDRHPAATSHRQSWRLALNKEARRGLRLSSKILQPAFTMSVAHDLDPIPYFPAKNEVAADAPRSHVRSDLGALDAKTGIVGKKLAFLIESIE
jgi:hypothetical protein